MEQNGSLYIISTPIGNLGDISARARTLLASVDEVWAENVRHSKKLLDHLEIAPRMRTCHMHNEAQNVPLLVARLQAGKNIALISDAGTPLINDPGYPLVRACHRHGLTVVPVPGPCALIAALSASALGTQRFAFEGFIPHTEKARDTFLQHLCKESRTLVFYESCHRIQASLLAMCKHFTPTRNASLAKELTKINETIMHDTLGNLLEAVQTNKIAARGEFVLLVEGAEKKQEANIIELERIVDLLLPEMSAARTARIASEITGVSHRQAYQLTLQKSSTQ